MMASVRAHRTMTFEAIGTNWAIESDEHTDERTWAEIEHMLRDRIDIFDRTYSRFREDSLVTAISHKAGKYFLPDDAEALLAFYRQMYEASDGKVTPLVGDLLVEAGYDASYSLQPQSTLHPVAKWDDVMAYERPELTVKKPVVLDFGAAGKGYIVDIIGELLEKASIKSFIIDASGDMLRRTMGNDTIRIGLGHPTDPTQVIGAAELGSGSLCGSGINRRQWAGLHHVMDPHDASPTQGIIATWATAQTALLADGMATALFLEEPARLRSLFTFEYLLVRDDFTFEHSSGFPGELFTESAHEPNR